MLRLSGRFKRDRFATKPRVVLMLLERRSIRAKVKLVSVKMRLCVNSISIQSGTGVCWLSALLSVSFPDDNLSCMEFLSCSVDRG